MLARIRRAPQKKPRVVLVHPRPTPGESCTVPYSILSVAAPLVAAGYPVEVLDEFATPDYEGGLARAATTADIVGISCFTGHQIDRAVVAARKLRALRPELPLVWGGYHPSMYPAETVMSPLADYVVSGQGEWMFLDIVERLACGDDIAGTPGLWHKPGDVPTKNPGGPAFRNLDDFPPFPYDLIPLKTFLIQSLTSKSIAYHSSLGCPFRCNFCAVTQIYNKRWSGFPSERVLRDVRYLVEQTGAESVEFYDNNFFVNDRRTREIAQGIYDARLGVVWSGEARPDKIAEYDDDMLSLLKKSGLSWVFIGAESGHDKVLELMERDHNVDHIIQAARKLARYDIKVTFSFNLGYPQEPSDNFARTEALCRELRAINPKTEIMVYITTAYEATPSFHIAQEMLSASGEPAPPPPVPSAASLEDWKHLDQRSGEGKAWLDPVYAKKLHNFSLAAFYATSLLHQRWRVSHRRNPFVRALGALASLHMRVGYYDTILDLRVLNKLFMETARPTRRKDMWTGR